MDCKRALEETKGDFEKATDLLRQRGVAVASKRQDRAASEGIIETYIHTGGQIGVMLELNCEKRSGQKAEVQGLATNWPAIAGQPEYLTRDEIDPAVIARERSSTKCGRRSRASRRPQFEIVDGPDGKQFSASASCWTSDN